MEKIINKFLLEYRNKNKKRFDLQSLEKDKMANYKDNQTYLKHGGYKAFYSQMVLLKENNILR